MHINLFWDVLFDYLRALSYAVVLLTDLRGIVHRKFDSMLFLGDTILAFALLVTAFNMGSGVFEIRAFTDVVLTPAAVVWAGIHFADFLKSDGHKKLK